MHFSSSPIIIEILQLVADVVISAGLFLVLSQWIRRKDGDERFQIGMDLSPFGLAIVGPEGQIDYANSAFSRTLRLSESKEARVSLERLTRPYVSSLGGRAFFPQQTEGERRHHIALTSRTGPATHLELRLRPFPQGLGWLALLDASDNLAAGRQDNVANVATDICRDAILVVNTVDPALPLIYANPAFQQLTGYGAGGLAGLTFRMLESREAGELDPHIVTALAGGNPTSATVRLSRKDGSTFLGDIRVAPVKPDLAVDGERPPYAVAVIQDLTPLRNLRFELDRNRNYDPVTSLPNRRRFEEVLGPLCQRAEGGLAVIMLAVRRFDEVMAAHGDDFVNLVLVQIAGRLSAIKGALVARTGVDQFAMALSSAGPDDITQRIAEISHSLTAAYVVPGSIVSLFFSFGYTVSRPGMDAQTVLRQATAALWSAADLVSGHSRPFDEGIDLAIRQRLELTRDLQGALGQGEFEVFYEPRYDLAAQELHGAEASIRWNHPVFGAQMPDRFMKIAEESGIILEIGAWAIGEIVAFAAAVNAGRAAPLHFGVNLTPVQITDFHLLDRLNAAIARTGADPGWFTVELTNGTVIGITPDLSAIFGRIRARGFGLALDDFQSASTSLGHLDDLPVTAVTVDQAFARGISGHPFRVTVISAVAAICIGRGIVVVAEGIDQEADRQLLQDIGCKCGQGPLFGPPLPGPRFLALSRQPASGPSN